MKTRKMVCPECGYEWDERAIEKKQFQDCPECRHIASAEEFFVKPDCKKECPYIGPDDSYGDSCCEYARSGGNCKYFCGYVPEENIPDTWDRILNYAPHVVRIAPSGHVPEHALKNEGPDDGFNTFRNGRHPAPVHYTDDEGICTVYPVCGVTRVAEETSVIYSSSYAAYVRKKYKEVVGLPEPEPNTWYIVSLVVFQNSDRTDLICPDSGPDSEIRDENGQIVAVKRFMIK